MNTKFSFKSNPLAGVASAIAVSSLCSSIIAQAAVLFSDNFNTNSSSLWTVNVAPAVNGSLQSATFAFDYSPYGIPPAPGSSDTFGLRLRSNLPIVGGVEVTTRPAGAVSGLSVSPTGKNFGDSYLLSFYAWVNFNGAPNALGLSDNGNSEGGTHNVLFAVGTSGTVPLVVGNTGLVTDGQMDGIGFATTGDGGIVNDYRVYPKSGSIVPGTTPGVYAAGSTANTAAYYMSLFPLVSAPSVQESLSTAEYNDGANNTQAGQTQGGSFGFAWHKVDITKSNNIVSWTIDGSSIATIDISSLGVVLGGNNIALGDSDVNTTTTRHPSLLFTLIDNLVVTDVPVGPSIQTSFSSGILKLSWPEATAGGFIPQYADSLSPPIVWSNVVTTIATNSGIVSVSLPATNAQRFFRLKQ